MKPPDTPAAGAAGLVARLRAQSPRVHCITNAVAEAFTANVLLAAGAVPSMTVDPAEVPGFVGRADALLVNLGTLDPQRRTAIEAALPAAREAGRPWLLDPVFVERSEPRLALARQLAARHPAVLRGNAAELAALIGAEADDRAVMFFARRQGLVAAMTGATDLVTDGARAVRVSNGHPLMGRVTAMGCAATALMAGFVAVADDPLDAAVACLAFVGVAAEAAGAAAHGPGSFVPAFLDALHALAPDDVAARARID